MTYPDVGTPAGPDYGLEPTYEVRPLPGVTSRDILSPNVLPDYRTGTELGGVDGLIQPPPHVPTGHERLMQVYAIDPTDGGAEAGSVVAPELEGDFRG